MGTTTTNLELYKPDVGEDDWGLLVNANWDVIDALELTGGGLSDVTVLGTPNVAVTSHTTQNATLLTSSARTTEQTVPFTNEFWRGVILNVNVTVDPATADITPGVQFQDPITLNWVAFWTAGTPISATGTFTYAIYPGVTVSTGLTEACFPLPLPRTCRLRMTVADTDSLTYSVAACFLL